MSYGQIDIAVSFLGVSCASCRKCVPHGHVLGFGPSKTAKRQVGRRILAGQLVHVIVPEIILRTGAGWGLGQAARLSTNSPRQGQDLVWRRPPSKLSRNPAPSAVRESFFERRGLLNSSAQALSARI